MLRHVYFTIRTQRSVQAEVTIMIVTPMSASDKILTAPKVRVILEASMNGVPTIVNIRRRIQMA